MSQALARRPTHGSEFGYTQRLRGWFGNQIELFLLEGPQKNIGASLVLLLSLVLMFFMLYYVILTQRASREAAR